MAEAHLPASSNMPKEVYTALYMCVCKALLEDNEEWDEAEVRARWCNHSVLISYALSFSCPSHFHPLDRRVG